MGIQRKAVCGAKRGILREWSTVSNAITDVKIKTPKKANGCSLDLGVKRVTAVASWQPEGWWRYRESEKR